jgi:hypothetical protein
MSLLQRKFSLAQKSSIPAGNIALSNVFQTVQDFGNDLSNIGIRLTPGGIYQFSAEAGTGTPFWQDVNFGTEWVDDGGASNAQFEAQLVLLNGGSVNNPQFTGWSGYNDWQPITQNLAWTDINDIPATSSIGVIIQVEVREIATPANIVTDQYEGVADNEP